MTDHLPNYFLITSNRLSKKSEHSLVRIFSERNVNDFKSRLSSVKWDHVYNCTDINDGYDYFESKISYFYQSSFKLVKLSRKKSKDKKWITAGLKRSSQHKNKLLQNWLHTKPLVDENKYKLYRRLHKKLTTEAKKSYYKELFDSRINSVKQLRTI